MKTAFLHKKHYHVCSGLNALYGALAGLGALNMLHNKSHNKTDSLGDFNVLFHTIICLHIQHSISHTYNSLNIQGLRLGGRLPVSPCNITSVIQ